MFDTNEKKGSSKIDFALFALDGCFHIHVLRVDSLSKPTNTYVSMICDNPVQW